MSPGQVTFTQIAWFWAEVLERAEEAAIERGEGTSGANRQYESLKKIALEEAREKLKAHVRLNGFVYHPENEQDVGCWERKQVNDAKGMSKSAHVATLTVVARRRGT